MIRSSLPRLFLGGLLIVAACAAPVKRDDAQNTFLWLRSIDGFDSIDDEHVVLHAGNKYALVKTFGRCDGLRFAEEIAVDSPLGYLDKSGFGSIIYRQVGWGKRRCPIDRIDAVASSKEARDRVAAEKADKAKAKADAPS